MIKDLLEREIEKRPATLRFEGRILYLVDDAELMRRQLFEDEGYVALAHSAARVVPLASTICRSVSRPTSC